MLSLIWTLLLKCPQSKKKKVHNPKKKKVHSLILMLLLVSLIPENWLVEKRTVTYKKLHEEEEQLHVLFG